MFLHNSSLSLPRGAVTTLMSLIGLFLLAWLKRLRKSAAELAVLDSRIGKLHE